MRCKKCGERLSCVDSRTFNCMCLRRYKCTSCGNIVKTFESISDESSWNNAYNIINKYFARKCMLPEDLSDDEYNKIDGVLKSIITQNDDITREEVLADTLRIGDVVSVKTIDNGSPLLIIQRYTPIHEIEYLSIASYLVSTFSEELKVIKLSAKADIRSI